MSVTAEEVRRLCNDLIVNHGSGVADIASMMMSLWSQLAHDEAVRHANFRCLMPCVNARLAQLGIAPQRLEAALRDLGRSNETLQYLMSLPE